MQYKAAILGLATLSVCLIGVGHRPAEAATYYQCRNGWTFQTNGDAARCYRPGQTQVAAHNRCLPGQQLRHDYQGRRDLCVTGFGTAVVTAPPGCPNGYRLAVRTGQDRCERRTNAQIEAPTRSVQR